jgi:outer membrane lipoprotein-sorting protein
MNKQALMWQYSAAYGLALILAGACYSPDAFAQKVIKDPTVSPLTARPKVAAPVAKPAPPPNLPKLSASQIVDKNVAARGGLAKWRAVQAMTMSGQMDAGGKANTQLPYTLQVKRPNKQRLAIEFAGQTSLQVFDGEKGWKLRPYLNRSDPEPFSKDELAKTEDSPGLDGPLIDYAAKGSKVEFDGTETVDGKATYRLKLTNKQGHASHVWIDGTTFLEAKMEGHPRRFDGTMREVDTYLTDYRPVDGLLIPFVAETRLQGVKVSHKMTVEKVALNPTLEDALFVKPASLPNKRRVFTVGSTANAANPNVNPPATAPASK